MYTYTASTTSLMIQPDVANPSISKPEDLKTKNLESKCSIKCQIENSVFRWSHQNPSSVHIKKLVIKIECKNSKKCTAARKEKWIPKPLYSIYLNTVCDTTMVMLITNLYISSYKNARSIGKRKMISQTAYIVHIWTQSLWHQGNANKKFVQ